MDDSLVVSGEMNQFTENKTEGGAIKESKSSSFARSISIPEGYNTKSYDKKYDDDGNIQVTIEKETKRDTL